MSDVAADLTERLREVLEGTGHPVLDVHAVRGEGAALLRVEFAYDGSAVGALRVHSESVTLGLVTSDGAERVDGLTGLRARLADLPPGDPGPGHARTLVSNDHLRAIEGVPESVVRDAVRDLLAELRGSGTTRSSDLGDLSLARLLLEVREEYPDTPSPSHDVAARTVALLRDLAAGAPREWALRRFVEARP